MKNYLFCSSQRIKRRKEFQELFQKSFRIYGSFFIFRIMYSSESKSKLGIMISKKFGNAVYRNRLKRVIREIFRHTDFPISISILVNQSRPISNNRHAYLELKKLFSIFSDQYLLKQYSLSQTNPLKGIQYSSSMSLCAKIACELLILYKKKLSPMLQESCRFSPSCSIYALEAIRVYGFLNGSILVLKRMIQCRPGGGTGFDPVPRKKIK